MPFSPRISRHFPEFRAFFPDAETGDVDMLENSVIWEDYSKYNATVGLVYYQFLKNSGFREDFLPNLSRISGLLPLE